MSEKTRESEETRRLFVAVDPSPAAVEDLAAIVDTLAVSRANAVGRSTRLAAQERWHVTMVFLGPIPVSRIDRVSRAIEAAAVAYRGVPSEERAGGDTKPVLGGESSWLRVAGDNSKPALGGESSRPRVAGDNTKPAPGGEPLRLRVAGGGTFGRHASTILWAGLGGDVTDLRRLADVLRRELRRAHVSFDNKSFHPHLTLARPGDRVAADLIKTDVAILSAYEGPLWTVDAVHLMASDMVATPTGPQPQYVRLASIQLGRKSPRW